MVAVALVALAALPLTACGLGMDASSAQNDINQINPADDAQAQANLQTAMVAAQQAYAADGSWAGAGPSKLRQIEPSLTYVSGASSGPNVVSVASGGTSWSAAILSSSGMCFFAVASTAGGTHTGSGKAPSCVASSAAQYAG
jgi:hypothetical protein